MEYEMLLINIARDFSGYSEGFKDSIGQYLIAAWLRKHSFQAYVFSGNVQQCKEVIRQEIDEHKVPVVGFYTAADNIRIAAHAVSWIKKNYPNVKTVIGGPQAIGLDYNFFERTGNDYAILGEGEIPVYMLLSSIVDGTVALEQVPSLVRRDEREKTLIVNQCENAVITELDTIPHPSMADSLKKNLRQGKVAGLITGRGCPYHCTFCYEGANAKNVRFRSIANVMEEVDDLYKNNRHIEYINIYDDTFTLDKDRVLAFCEEISKRKIKWFCEGHISFVLKNPDILKKMVESGLTCIQFGIESGSKAVLDAYCKHTDSDSIIKAVQICKKAGIHGITGNFIIGGALETKETVEESKRLAKELIQAAKGMIELYVVYFAPYPNTRIVNEPETFGIRLHKDLEKRCLNTMRCPVVETKGLSVPDIYEQKREFEVYLEQLYKDAASVPDKADVVQGLFEDGKRMHLNPTWERHYLSHPYIVAFLEHLSEEEQIFQPSHYIIRTFEDFVIEKDVMRSEAGEFCGLEMRILADAAGIYNAYEMSQAFAVPLQKIQETYEQLNSRCLVYMSEF